MGAKEDINTLIKKYDLEEDRLSNVEEGKIKSRNYAVKKNLHMEKKQIQDLMAEIEEMENDMERWDLADGEIDEKLNQMKNLKEEVNGLKKKLNQLKTKAKTDISEQLRTAKKNRDSYVQGLDTKAQLNVGPKVGSKMSTLDNLINFMDNTWEKAAEREKILPEMSKEEQKEVQKEALKEKMGEEKEKMEEKREQMKRQFGVSEEGEE